MNSNVMKTSNGKLLAAILAMAMIVCAVAVVAMPSDAEDTVTVPSDAEEIGTASDLTNALSTGGIYKLTADITVSGPVSVSKTTTLYLNGFDVTSSSTTDGTVFDMTVQTGTDSAVTLTIYGTGDISSSVTGGNAAIDVRAYCTLVLDGGVSIVSDGYGVVAWTNGTVTVNNATITSDASALGGNGTNSESTITVNGGTFTSESSAAVYFPSTKTLDINGGTFNGLTGIEVRAGTVTIDGATINATGSLSDAKEGTDGPLNNGMAVAVIDRNGYATGSEINVTIGSDVVLNGNSYDVYVGDINGTADNKVEGAFNTATVGDEYQFIHTIKLTMPGFVFDSTASTNGYRFAAVDVSATSFTIPAGFVVDGKASFDATNSVELNGLIAGNGGITISKGSVEISGIISGVKTADQVADAISGATGEIVLKNLTITSGTLDISGDVSVEGNVIVSEEATIAIQDNSSLNVAENAVLSVSGKVTVTETGSALNNEGTVAITNTKAEVPSVIGGSGNVDSSAVASEGTLSGSYDTTTTFTQNQIITVVSDTILVEGTQFVFEGKLIIPEGVTLTIEAGAQLVVSSSTGIIENNGTIIIESDASMVQTASNKYITAEGGFAALGTSKIINNGTIELAYYADVNGNDAVNGQFCIDSTATVENNGAINVGEESMLISTGSLVNSADATINMNGFLKAIVQNAGTIIINGTMSQTSSENTIIMTAEGATVQIDKLTGHLAVNDTGISNNNIKVTNGDDSSNLTRAGNYLRIQATENNVVSGLTITSEIVTEANESDKKNPYYMNNLVVSGSMSVSLGIDAAEGSVASAELTTNGPRFFVNDEFILDAGITYDVKGTLNVAGTVNVDEKATLTSSDSGTINVTTGTVAIETNAIKSPLTPVASYYKVSKTTTTPEMHYYTTLANALASGATPITVYGALTIDEDLTINDGITVNAQSTVTIKEEGSLTINDGGRLNAGPNTVTVDGSLYAANEKTGLRGTSNIKSDVVSRGESDVLYTNLYNALNDAESGDTVTMNQSKTTDRDFTVKEGVTLKTGSNTLTLGNDTVATVNGTIYTNGGALAVEATQAENEKAGSVTLNGLIQSDMPMDYGGAYPAGAYYSITSSGKVLYYISPVEDAAAIISTVDQSTITINGNITIGDVSFTGTSDEGAVIIIEDEITAGTITLDYAEMQITPAGKFSGTVTDGTGTVTVNVSGSDTAAIASATVDDAKALVVSGTFGNTVMEDTKYAFTVAGTVDIDGATIPGVTVEGTMDVTGNSSITGAFVIGGTVNVDAGVTLTANTAATTISGILNAMVDDNGTRATVTLGTVYVGLELVDGKISTATAGEITGTITYSTLYVSADSTVPEALTDNKSFTGFYVEDALWLTAYGTTANVTNAPVENADFQGWDNPATDAKETLDGSNITIASYERLDAVIDYNVYNVTINTDGGIGSVAIDGNILSGIGNSFTAKGLTAGEHKVTYTLKNGFEGEATLSSSTVTVNGLTFTLSGDFEDDNGTPITYVLNLSGTTPADSTIVIDGGNGGSGELGLTDYLLIILVILIVIMAIIVAMRLMRS